MDLRIPKSEIRNSKFEFRNLVSGLTTVGGCLRLATDLLSEAGIPSPRLDAELLLAHVVGLERWRLVLERDRKLTPSELQAFKALIEQRLRRQPVAYILGRKEFWSLPLKVTPAVMIPRPETEVLVEAALRQLRGVRGQGSGVRKGSTTGPCTLHPGPIIVELGTGSGAIALALAKELPQAEIYATDRSPEALAIARGNACSLGLAQRIVFLQGDLYEPLPEALAGKIDLLISNPPYIPSEELERLEPEVRLYEPRMALDGGPDGLEIHRRISASAGHFLRPGGLLALEIGADQGKAAVQLLEKERLYNAIEVVRDYAGHDRVLLARLRREWPVAGDW